MAILSAPIPIKVQCGCGQRYAFDVEPVAGRLPGPVKCPVCGVDGTATANGILAERLQAQAPAPISLPAQNGPVVAIPSVRVGPISVAVPAVAPAVSTPSAAPLVPPPPGAAPRVTVAVTPPSPPTAGVARVAVAVTPSASTSASVARVATVAAPATESAPAAVAHVAPKRTLLPGQVDPEQAKKEARAKILWGDDPADVAKFLRTNGFNAQEAQDIIAPLLAERAAAVRKTGMNKIFTGIGMVCVPIIGAIIFLAIGFFPVKIFGALVCIGLWGAYRVLTGTMMVIAPKGEKGDVSEM